LSSSSFVEGTGFLDVGNGTIGLGDIALGMAYGTIGLVGVIALGMAYGTIGLVGVIALGMAYGTVRLVGVTIGASEFP
jgi:hypothetical protein